MATVIASENFNSEEDATALRRALRDTSNFLVFVNLGKHLIKNY